MDSSAELDAIISQIAYAEMCAEEAHFPAQAAGLSIAREIVRNYQRERAHCSECGLNGWTPEWVAKVVRQGVATKTKFLCPDCKEKV